MAEVVFMRRELGALRPVDPVSAEALERVPRGQDVRVTITRPRNLRHHRKFFALLNAIFPHQNTWPTLEAFRGALLCAIGHGDVTTIGGRTLMQPRSISFGAMDQGEFEQFYERAVELILTRILPGLKRTDLDREVEEIMAGRDGRAA